MKLHQVTSSNLFYCSFSSLFLFLITTIFLGQSLAHDTGADDNGTVVIGDGIFVKKAPVHQYIATQATAVWLETPSEIKSFAPFAALTAQLNKMCEAPDITSEGSISVPGGLTIITGSADEDQAWNPLFCPPTLTGSPHLPPYREDRDELGYFEHFWDPDEPLVEGYEPLRELVLRGYNKGLVLQGVNNLFVTSQFDSAYRKAQDIWDNKIIPLYKAGKKPEAYYWLGRVVHLLTDLAVPAHVHLDPHALTLGDDSFEDYFKDNPSEMFSFTGKTFSSLEYKHEFLPNMSSFNWNTVHLLSPSPPPDLFKLFWYTAQKTQYFASDGNPWNEAGYFGDSGKYKTVDSEEKFFSSHLWQGDIIGSGNPGQPSKKKKINLKKDIIDDPDQLEIGSKGEEKNLRTVANALIPHALKSVASLYRLFWFETHTLPTYTVTRLDPSDDFSSVAFAINASGQAVGDAFFETPNGLNESHAALWEDGDMIDLGTLGTFSFANGINARRQVVGVSELIDLGPDRAFLWENGEMQDLDTLGGESSLAFGINDSTQVVGTSLLPNDASHAFLWTPGGTDGVPSNPQMRDLGTLGGLNSTANEIDALGKIVGVSDTANGERHAFLWTPGGIDGVPGNPQMRDLRTLGGTRSSAFKGNISGQIVGGSTTNTSGSSFHAFLWSPGGTDGVPSNPQMRDLGTLGGSSSFANSINSSGQVVGDSFLSGDMIEHAFLWQNGVITNLNDLIPADSGWELISATDINDVGQIVGIGVLKSDPDRLARAFLLTPVAP